MAGARVHFGRKIFFSAQQPSQKLSTLCSRRCKNRRLLHIPRAWPLLYKVIRGRNARWWVKQSYSLTLWGWSTHSQYQPWTPRTRCSGWTLPSSPSTCCFLKTENKFEWSSFLPKKVNFTHVGASVTNFAVIWHHGNFFLSFLSWSTSQRTEDNRLANCSHRKQTTLCLP